MIDGEVWHVRGVNIEDPNSRGACDTTSNTTLTLAKEEVIRRVGVAATQWNVTGIRLAMYDVGGSSYIDSLVEIINTATTKYNLYVLLSVQFDPSQDPKGMEGLPGVEEIPTSATVSVWERIAPALVANPRVLFGITNEPHCDENSCSASYIANVKSGMIAVITAIRNIEQAMNCQFPHIIVAQGCSGYASDVSCYVGAPLGDPQVAYEIHVYNSPSDLGQTSYAEQVWGPSEQIPLIIGEYGPSLNPEARLTMNFTDLLTFVMGAENRSISYMAWTFHSSCQPNLLAATGNSSCILASIEAANDSYGSTPTWGLLADKLVCLVEFCVDPARVHHVFPVATANAIS